MSSQPPSQSPTTTKSKGKASQNSQPSQGLKAHWDTKSTEIFVKFCVEQVKAGHRPGLELDPLTRAIMASDDWWNLNLQRYPDAAKFCEKPLTLADDMDILFSDVSATGKWAYTPSFGVFHDNEGSHTPLGDDTDTKIHPSELSNQCRRQKEGSSKKQKGNKKQSAISELSKTLNRIVDAVEASSSTGT
ncbi:uncharacterized protein LOC114307129 [Camellia sinensis]|uniref:uncharacterized protein LOC114307129 n=1 Tax=Camellia sinensis TaxID=4442 RepID=UPI0010362684|nr:uncharacterized protein LOC114307129 [Camellia sinensis]